MPQRVAIRALRMAILSQSFSAILILSLCIVCFSAALGMSDFGLRPLSDLRAAKRLGLKNQVKGHRMPVDKPIATFLLFQVLAFGSASVGTILALVLWAWRIDQWEMMTDPFFWHLAGATMGTIFWGGCAAPFAQIAWQRRSWFFASTLLPGLVVFPLLIWRQLTVV